MQPEPIPVSQHTPAVDLNEANVSPRQHGYDFEDRPVPVPAQRDEASDSVDVNLQMPEMSASVSAVGPNPPYHPVSFKLPVESLPNEVLTHILSHLPPESLSAITLVSRRFHALVTTPHAWRIAFSRFFPGPQALDERCYPVDEADVVSDKRSFMRLTALASWRSEYILRTRLLRSLARGKPAQFQPCKKNGSVRSASVRNGSAVTTYTSQLVYPVSHIHGSFNGAMSSFIHSASEQGVASASDPSAVKVGTWGLSDHQVFRHFADQFPGDSQYGLGPGEMVGVPNSMDVSQPYGMIYGEGCPAGRVYFISITEQRGRFLGISDLGSLPNLGIPAVNLITQVICSVWIAKSPSILKTTGGLIAMMSGSSSGVLSAYAIGPHPTYDKRYERGQLTAKWVLCPGVPIIGIAVDDNYSPERRAQRRIWAVVLNALGEIFYLTDLPRQPEISPTAKLNAEQIDELAWKTGRSVQWELNELSRRVACPDSFNQELVDGSYSPRSSPDSMGLDDRQLTAETKEIEKFMSFKPKHFRKVCKGWDMQRDLQVDFAGDDGLGSGQSVIVIARGSLETARASVRRYLHAVLKSDSTLTPSTPGEAKTQTSIFGGPVKRSVSISDENSHLSPVKSEWRISDFVFGSHKLVEVTTTAMDNSRLATLTMQEDLLLTMSSSSYSSASSSPMIPHMEHPRSKLEVPGQRARFLAVGTSTGMVFVWDIRALASRNVEIINSVPPLRIIQTESPRVSCVALTSLYLVHGGNDGLVQAWDPLASSTRPIRTINSRFSTRARRRLVQAEASVTGVGNNYYAASAISLDPDSTSLRGMVSLGTHLRFWSYSSTSADQYKTSKRQWRRAIRGSNQADAGQRFSNSGRGAIHDFIEDERVEIVRQQIEDTKKRAHLSTRFGVDLLGPDIDEDQLLAYAQLLSEEAYNGDTTKRGEQPPLASSVSTSASDAIGPSSSGFGGVSSSSSPYQDSVNDEVDGDLAEAIRLSLLDEKSSSSPLDQTAFIPIKYAKGVKRQPLSPSLPDAESSQQKEMDDLEFAIQLSLAEDQSRESQDWEEFPVLVQTSLSSSQSSGKGKGKARDI